LTFFIWLEGTGLSIWIRESPSLLGFPFILYLHTLGLAMIAGLSSAVALALLVLHSLPHGPNWRALFRLVWIGLAINALSGVALLIAYPAKALTNPVFYIKLVAIAGAVAIVQWLERGLTGTSAARTDHAAGPSAAAAAATIATPTAAQKRAALLLLLLWLIATLAGRLLAYTYSILMARNALLF
jgi:hypothetical protein